jgi:hypothetical protein
MAERMHIPTSPACGHWETLLADALDGLLKPEDEATFTSHMAACPACAALFEESRRGREWLDFLDAEPEVPEGLLEKLLAHTGPGKDNEIEWVSGGAAVIPNVAVPAWQRPGFMGFVRRFAEPRLLMTAAMAFFSITVTLNMTGVKLTALRLSDLRPAAIKSYMERQFTVASVPIIRYYDHLRFVYEVESKMRQLRGNVIESQGNSGEQKQQPSQPVTPGESKQVPSHKDGGSRLDVPQQDQPQQSVQRTLPDSGDFVETRFELNTHSRTSNNKFGVETNTISGIQKARAHFGGSTNAVVERGTRWIVQTTAI